MTSNSAKNAGGAIDVHGASIVSVTDCVMTSNSAVWGGAVAAQGSSAVTAIDSTMASNNATYGGAVHAGVTSSVTAASCYVTSNCAISGGAVMTSESSVVTLSDGAIELNRAKVLLLGSRRSICGYILLWNQSLTNGSQTTVASYSLAVRLTSRAALWYACKQHGCNQTTPRCVIHTGPPIFRMSGRPLCQLRS